MHYNTLSKATDHHHHHHHCEHGATSS